MKALTLHQPWATFWAMGIKINETRSWPTKYRGLLAIHAAKSLPGYARDFLRLPQTGEIFQQYEVGLLPFGCIVGVVTLGDCIEINDADLPSDLEISLGDWRQGRYAWRGKNHQQLSTPVYIRGMQGLWTVPEPTVETIMRRLEGKH